MDRLPKRLACEQLVKLALLSTESMYRLAKGFPEPFREIAEEMPHFPCLFPAHADDLRSLQKIIWDEFNLGKRHTLKLRHAPGRKTFSTKTWVNSLLIRLIELVHESARREDDELGPFWDDEGTSFQRVAYCVPLNPDPKNVKEWLDAIWKLLLTEIPEPEKHPRLRQLGGRPSKVHDVRATIKAKLGTYLERMLNDHAVHK